MRSIPIAVALLAISALAAFLPGRAAAAPVSFVGSLGVEVLPFPIVAVTGSGVAEVSGTGFTLPAGAFSGTKILYGVGTYWSSVDTPQASLANAAGSFQNGRGTMPVAGAWRVCLFTPGCLPHLSINVPLSTNGGLTGLGVGGSFVATGAINVTVGQLAPWTLGPVSVVGLSTGTFRLRSVTPSFQSNTWTVVVPKTPVRTGFAHGPASATDTAYAPGGTIQLVTPLAIRTSLTSAIPLLVGFGELTIRFVPEPGTLLLLASGAALLAVAGRQRRAGR